MTESEIAQKFVSTSSNPGGSRVLFEPVSVELAGTTLRCIPDRLYDGSVYTACLSATVYRRPLQSQGPTSRPLPPLVTGFTRPAVLTNVVSLGSNPAPLQRILFSSSSAAVPLETLPLQPL